MNPLELSYLWRTHREVYNDVHIQFSSNDVGSCICVRSRDDVKRQRNSSLSAEPWRVTTEQSWGVGFRGWEERRSRDPAAWPCHLKDAGRSRGLEQKS